MGRRPGYDKFGYCAITGELLLEDRVIDGKLQKVFKPTKDSMSFVLNDGSMMRVSVSKKAKESFTNTKQEINNLMGRVREGWRKEADNLVRDGKWDQEKALEHMESQKDKEIFERFDDIPINNLTNIDYKIQEYRKRLIKQTRDKIKEGDNGSSQ
jgi:hypothetical protein